MKQALCILMDECQPLGYRLRLALRAAAGCAVLLLLTATHRDGITVGSTSSSAVTWPEASMTVCCNPFVCVKRAASTGEGRGRRGRSGYSTYTVTNMRRRWP